jgi:Fe-S-cluster containining protein
MTHNTAIFLIDESEPFNHFNCDNTELIATTIDIADTSIHLKIGVTDDPVRLSDIVPLARAISDRFSAAFRDNLVKNHKSVPCHKGCSACCNYLVALSIPEVFYFQDELAAMPAYSRSLLLQSCLDSAKKILDWDAIVKHQLFEYTDINQISNWYSELSLPCPFLSDSLCGIYEKRPLACREHIVTTSPASCKNNEIKALETTDAPVSILKALGQLAADFEQTEVEAMIMPLAFIYTDNNPLRSHHTWPATIMVKHFIHILETMASAHLPEPSVTH